MQDKIVGKMCLNVLYNLVIVPLVDLVPYVQIRAGFDFFFFFYSFVVKAAPQLFDIFSSKNTAAFTPANTVVHLKLGAHLMVRGKDDTYQKKEACVKVQRVIIRGENGALLTPLKCGAH